MTVQLKELREQQARIATNARAKFDEIKDDTPAERAAEIEREFDAMMADHDKIGVRMERLQKLEEAEKRANAGDPRRPKGDNGEARSDAEEETVEYKDVFTKAMRFGVADLSVEERGVLMHGRNRDKDVDVRAQATAPGAAGGYLIPEGFSGEIDKALAAWGPMLDENVARQYPTATGNPIPWPTSDDTAERGEQHTENGAVTDDGSGDVVLGQKTLNAYVYDSKVVKVSLELLQDSYFSMEGLLSELFGERLGRTGNEVLTVGDGTNKPHGVVTASSLGLTAAAVDAIAADELIDLQHSVDPAYRESPRCYWQFNDLTLAAIRKLKDGQNNYLWQMGDVKTGAPATLLGKPYKINQAMASIATGNRAVIFGDHSKYVVRRVGQMQMVALRERYMDNLQVGFIAFMRLDGELLDGRAVKHLALA
ncbi:phage major capsid protein [Aquamicrobium sp. LC103]|uniref:phage major capsid protein n=1 Tax=Aquamicrobium sp. LC103 TaxID=1120658 RepID=UPI00063E8D5B|nr:phage major capsid protein [Aquamicrobium sp. LC103]TKT78416.1 phage major capsid protein [Aquamicrobium sp. LC103]